MLYLDFLYNNTNDKRPLSPKSMPPAGDEHAKLKTWAPHIKRKKLENKIKHSCI